MVEIHYTIAHHCKRTNANRSYRMKRTLLTATIALSIAFGLCPAYASDGPSACSLATLRGTMAWASTYSKDSVPRAASGFESYDGRGHMKYRELVSDGFSTNTYTGTGTYTVTPDCIASVVYDGVGAPFVYFVSPDGSAYFWANNQNFGVVSSGKAERVSYGQLVK
jgi:hypothetical protein